MLHFATAAFCVSVERITGYPESLQRRIGHPVVWFGRLIGLLDDTLNQPALGYQANRMRGVFALLILIAIVLLGSLGIAWTLRTLPLGWIIEAILAAPLLAQRSLREHVTAVAAALENSLDQGRAAVGRIVGRDPASLDESGVPRAALESLSENTSDGIVAPACWLALLGLPGIVVYKAINTADSMIGHRTPRYESFGWAAARLDDLVNWPFSRLTGLLFAAAAGSGQRAQAALHAMRRDARRHVSPNAGWPEAALAGALGIRLGGPRLKDGTTIDLAWIGDGRLRLDSDDIRAGLRLYARALTIFAAGLVAAALAASALSAVLQ